MSNDELISAGDDHDIKLWRLSKNQNLSLLILPNSLFAVAIAACPPKLVTGGLVKSTAVSTFVTASTDGRSICTYKSNNI